ncbi:MAG: hypothetical protein IPL40_16540 [Proteobacteria bacterium]|nr:hypothetical protein [Pseudomonadota bacterium]
MQERRSRAEWSDLCGAYESSGEAARAFARRQGVHPETLCWWRTKLRGEGALGGAAKGFVEVVSAAPMPAVRAVVRIGKVAIDFGDGLPPTAWVAELAAQC